MAKDKIRKKKANDSDAIRTLENFFGETEN